MDEDEGSERNVIIISLNAIKKSNEFELGTVCKSIRWTMILVRKVVARYLSGNRMEGNVLAVVCMDGHLMGLKTRCL